jgi:hypothetical protein
MVDSIVGRNSEAYCAAVRHDGGLRVAYAPLIHPTELVGW